MPVRNKRTPSNNSYLGEITGITEQEKQVLKDAGISGDDPKYNASVNYILSGKEYREWTLGTTYSKDDIVLYNNNFYKVLNTVTSTIAPDKDTTNFSLYNIENEILGTLEATY